MRHQQKNRKFGREKGQRNAFFKSLVSNLILKGKIETTEARAKTLRSRAEKLVTLAKKQNLASLRILVSRISKKPALKLYHDIAPKYAERKGGYLRIVKLGKKRLGDASKVSRIEFV
jgi:large subunit ribosomal protein L17